MEDTEERTSLQDMTELLQWITDDTNLNSVAQALAQASIRDKRRLRSKTFKDESSIWGHISNRVFSENLEIQRFFIYTIWKENRHDIQLKFDQICGRKRTRCLSPIHITDNVFCICKKTFEKYVDPGMLQCSTCQDWFHFICVNVEEDYPSSKDYICPYCLSKTKIPMEFEVSKSDQHNYSFIVDASNTDDAWDMSSLASSIDSVDKQKDVDQISLLSIGDDELDVPLTVNLNDSNEGNDFIDKLIMMDCEDDAGWSHPFAALPGAIKRPKFSGEENLENKPAQQFPQGEQSSRLPTPLARKLMTTATFGDVDQEESEELLKAIPVEFNISIPREEFQKICKIDINQIKLKPTVKKKSEELTVRTFTILPGHGDVLFKYFHKANPFCLLGFDKKMLRRDDELGGGGAQIRIYSHCTREGCKGSFAFTCLKVPMDPDDVVFKVSKTKEDAELCHSNKNDRATRQLKGPARDKLKIELEYQMPHKVQRKLLKEEPSLEGLRSGNYAFIHDLKVLQKAKSEKTHEHDLSKDAFVDLVATKLQMDTEIVGKKCSGYLQNISMFPFQMALYIDQSMEIYHKMTYLDKELVLIIDATGNLLSGLPQPLGNVQSLKEKRPLLYSVILASYKPGAADFPIYEFTSTAHSYADVTSMLLHYFERYKRLFDDPRPFYGSRRAEIDFSKTLLSALINVFSRSDTTTYFKRLWNGMVGQLDEFTKQHTFPIHICRWHALRFLRLNIIKKYPKSPHRDEIVKTWMAWSQSFVYSKDAWSMCRRMSDLSYYAEYETGQKT